MSIRTGFGEQISPPAGSAFSTATTVSSTQIVGLSSRQILFGSAGGGIAQFPLFEFDSTQGFLGIGSSAPTAMLFLQSTAGTTNILTVVAGTTNKVAFNIKSTGSTSRIAFFSTGGTTRPAAYTTGTATTARVLPSTVSTVLLSTVVGAGLAAFGADSSAAYNALVVRVNSLSSAVARTAEVLQTLIRKDMASSVGYGLLV